MPFRRRPQPFDFERLEFEPFDVDAALSTLQIKRLAADNGRAEIPDSNDTSLDGPQNRIIQYVQGRGAETLAKVTTRLDNLLQRVTQVDLSGAPGRVTATLAAWRSQLEELEHLTSQELTDLETETARCDARLAAIRARYRLDRPARNHQHDLLSWSVLAVLWLLQAVLNAYFFALGHEYGLLGGTLFAMILAGVDVTLSTFFGYLGRFVRAGRALVGVGAVFCLVGAAWIVSFNLLAAHLREALLTLPVDSAMSAAAERLLAAPLSLHSADTWLLFLLGLVFSAAALANGFKLDDPVPGYGRAQAKKDRLEAELAEVLAEQLAAIDAARETAVTALEDEQRSTENELAALQAAVTRMTTLLANAKAYVEHVEGSCNAMIATYRDLNRRFRSTPAPAYFDTAWDYPMPAEISEQRIEYTELVASQRTHQRRCSELAQEAVHEVQESAVALRSRLLARASQHETAGGWTTSVAGDQS